MNSVLEWAAMGGYSIYVWPAYGLAALVFILNILGIYKQKKHTRYKLKLWFKH